MKTKTNKAYLIILIFVMAAALTACSGGSNNSGVNAAAPTINIENNETPLSAAVAVDRADAGRYTIYSLMVNGEEYDEEFFEFMEIYWYIALYEDGTMEISTDESIKGTWEPGKIMYREHGEDVINLYTLANGLLTIEIDSGPTMTFRENEGAQPASAADNGNTAGLSDALAWWDRSWYGYWTIYSDEMNRDEATPVTWDCYGIIEINPDKTGMVFLWDDDMEIGKVKISIDGITDEDGNMGRAISEGGILLGHPIEFADWIIYPEYADYDTMIEIKAYFVNANGDGFYYEIYLRPWGMLWNDIPEDKRPPDYEWWYVGEEGYKIVMTAPPYGR